MSSSNASAIANPPAELDTIYNTESMLLANSKVTDPTVDPQAIDPVIYLWNGTEWLLPVQVINKTEQSVTAFMDRIPSVQVALFFSYHQQHGVFLFAEPFLCCQMDQSSATFVVQRTLGYVGPATVEWLVEPLFGFGPEMKNQSGILYFDEGQKSVSLQIAVVAITGLYHASAKVRLVSASDRALIDAERAVSVLIVTSPLRPYGVVEFVELEPIVRTPEEARMFRYEVERRCSRDDLVNSTVVFRTSVTNPDGDSASSQIALSRKDWLLVGSSRTQIEFTVVDDDVPELNSTYAVNIDYARPGVSVGSNSKIWIYVEENDDARGVIEFLEDNTTALESAGGNISVSIVRRRGAFGDIEVVWLGRNRTAVVSSNESEADIRLLNDFTLTYAEDENMTHVVVGIVKNSIVEDVEVFDLELVNAKGGARLGNRTVHRIVKIPTNDHQPLFPNRLASVVIQEADVVKKNFVIFTVSVVDPDPGLNGLLRYNISGGNCTFLDIDRKSGKLYYPEPIFSVITELHCYTLLTATDSGRAPLSDTMRVQVTVNYSFSCPPGQYSDTSFLPCVECPTDSFQTYFGARNCTRCRSGYFTEGTGSIYESECKGGYLRLRRVSSTVLFHAQCLCNTSMHISTSSFITFPKFSWHTGHCWFIAELIYFFMLYRLISFSSSSLYAWSLLNWPRPCALSSVSKRNVPESFTWSSLHHMPANDIYIEKRFS